jgi:hypothetical protein
MRVAAEARAHTQRFFTGELKLEARKLESWDENWDAVVYDQVLRPQPKKTK